MRQIRLNESQFNRLVSKCVKKALNEGRYRSIDANEAYEMLKSALSEMNLRDLVESKIYQIANSIQNQSNPFGQNKGYIVDSKSGGLSNNVLTWLSWAGTSFEEGVNDFISQVR